MDWTLYKGGSELNNDPQTTVMQITNAVSDAFKEREGYPTLV